MEYDDKYKEQRARVMSGVAARVLIDKRQQELSAPPSLILRSSHQRRYGFIHISPHAIRI